MESFRTVSNVQFATILVRRRASSCGISRLLSATFAVPRDVAPTFAVRYDVAAIHAVSCDIVRYRGDTCGIARHRSDVVRPWRDSRDGRDDVITTFCDVLRRSATSGDTIATGYGVSQSIRVSCSWSQFGSFVTGEAVGDYFGSDYGYTCLSADGKIFVSSSIHNDSCSGNAGLSDCGQVRVFRFQ